FGLYEDLTVQEMNFGRPGRVVPDELGHQPGGPRIAIPPEWPRFLGLYAYSLNNATASHGVEVVGSSDGELIINNGVTRATRIHYQAPGQLIPVEITNVRPKANFSKLLRVRDVPPPQ